MENISTIVGLDVHKDTLVAAVLKPNADAVSEQFTVENKPENVRRMLDRFVPRKPVTFVYEAGPCGYEFQRQMEGAGFKCVVISPAHTPVRPGDRVKTDRRDAIKLARLFRAGELTEIRIPTREEEAARDLVRIREDILQDQLRARHRLLKFLLKKEYGYSLREVGKVFGVGFRGVEPVAKDPGAGGEGCETAG